MAGHQPEESVRLPLLRQRWATISFLHWSYEPSVIDALLPDALEPDEFGGRAWVSMTPFLARGTRLSTSPLAPLFSDYPETNLRTYVRGPDGRDGIYFFTLEVGNPAIPPATQFTIGVPFRWATMSVDEGSTVTYRSNRVGMPQVCHDIAVEPGSKKEPSELDDWLTGRWRAYSRTPLGQLVSVPVEHEPWTIHTATATRVDETLRSTHGLESDGSAPELVHWSPGVSARLGPPSLVRP